MICALLFTQLLAPQACLQPLQVDYEVHAHEELHLLDDLHLQLPERLPRATDPDSLQGIARRIAYCESGLRNSKNPHSTASGYFQFLDGTWQWVTNLGGSADDYPLSVQVEAFYELWDNGEGASHWEPSRYCWELEEPWEHYDR